MHMRTTFIYFSRNKCIWAFPKEEEFKRTNVSGRFRKEFKTLKMSFCLERFVQFYFKSGDLFLAR